MTGLQPVKQKQDGYGAIILMGFPTLNIEESNWASFSGITPDVGNRSF